MACIIAGLVGVPECQPDFWQVFKMFKQMKTILVPTDFSVHALYALKVAASIAKKINAEIKLVHAFNIPSAEYVEDYYYEEYYNEIKAQAGKKLNTLADMDILKGIELSKHFVTNVFMWELVTDNEYKNVDLIVIGSHGESGFNKVFIGSNTDKIVRLADSPVLTIKNEDVDFNIKTMVFASDFYGDSYAVFEKIKFFADLYMAHIDLLKVITPKDFEPTPISKKLLEDFVKHFKLTDYSSNIYNATSIEKGITDFSDEINADLIAIETHGRTGIAHLINGSLAEDIANHIDRPILSIKMEKKLREASNLSSYPKDYRNWGAE